MTGLFVKVDSKDVQELLAVTTRNLRATMRRGMDGAGGVLMRQTRKLIDVGERKPYFQRRKQALILQYAKLTRRMRYSWAGKEVLKAVSAPPRGAREHRDMATAIELGSPYAYTQFVKEHQRQRKTVFGKPANPYTEHVGWYLRQHTERSGQFYLNRAIDDVAPEAAKPLEKALQILLNERRAPTRAELGGA